MTEMHETEIDKTEYSYSRKKNTIVLVTTYDEPQTPHNTSACALRLNLSKRCITISGCVLESRHCSRFLRYLCPHWRERFNHYMNVLKRLFLKDNAQNSWELCICFRRLTRKNTFRLSFSNTWWGHQMETFSALMAPCEGNSTVTGEFPSQRPVTRSFDVFFDLRQNKLLSKQSWGWWFETPSFSLWRHFNDNVFADNTGRNIRLGWLSLWLVIRSP